MRKKRKISKPLWTQEEIESLERQLKEKVPIRLMHIHGRSRNAINNKLHQGSYIPRCKVNRIWIARELDTLMLLTLNQHSLMPVL